MSVDPRTSEELDKKIAQLSQELCDLLGVAQLDEETLAGLDYAVENPFIDGIEPMDFASFSLALDGVPLSEYQIDFFGRVGLLTARGFVSRYRQVRELFCIWGKGSGKGWCLTRFFAWVTYILFHMVNPKQYFRPRLKTIADERIEIINIAPKGDLAKEIVFEYMTRNFKRDIFNPYVINEREQFLTDRIYFPQLNLHIMSLNSSASGLDGYNPFLWCMDEADAFLNTANKSNAALLRRILSSSAGTRWPGMWMGITASYMRSGAGYLSSILHLFKTTPSPGVFIDQAASWDVNPNISRNDPDVKQAYFEDPVAAAAMYEGIVPPVVDPFIHRSEYIRMSIGDQKSPVVVKIHDDVNDLLYRDIHGQQKAFVWCEVEHVQKEPGRRYYMGVDAAETGDGFAISVFSVADDGLLGPHTICPRCWGRGKDFYQTSVDQYAPVGEMLDASTLDCAVCGHTPSSFQPNHVPNAQKVLGWYRRVAKESGTKVIEIGGESVVVPHVREDVLILLKPIGKRVHPSLPDGAAVDFLSAQAVITTLCKELGIDSAGFDAKEMVGTIQYVGSETRTNAQKMSFSNPDQFLRGRLVRFFLYSGLVTFAGTGVTTEDVVEIAIREAEQLQKIKQRLDHPQGGSKDIWDARAIAIYLAVTANITGGEIEWLFREKTGEEVGKPKDPS